MTDYASVHVIHYSVDGGMNDIQFFSMFKTVLKSSRKFSNSFSERKVFEKFVENCDEVSRNLSKIFYTA